MNQPRITQWSWPRVLPQLASMGLLIVIFHLTLAPADLNLAILLGAGTYLVYSFGSRYLLLQSHRRGLALSDQGQFDKAIGEFQNGYKFLSKYSWIDRFRTIALMSPSTMSYREMALLNIAHAYGQMGDQDKVREYCEKTLEEFPDSVVARNTMRLLGTDSAR